MKNFIQFALIGFVLLAVAVVYDGFYILQEGTQAVVTQFGAPVGTPKTEAGPYLKIPFVQKISLFDKKILIWDGEPNQIPTNDKTYVYLDVTARWKIKDALKYMQTVKNEPRAQSMLDDIIDGTVRDLVNKNNLIEIIRSSDWSLDTMSEANRHHGEKPQKGRDVISEEILTIAQKATPKYGIELMDVMIKRVNYIESVRLTVYNRMISERQRIAAEKRSIGEGKKAEILGKIEKDLQEIMSKAKRDAMELKGKADAEATRIYGEAYSQNPEFYAFSKTLEGYENIVGKNTSLIISSDSDLFRYLNSIDGKK